SLTMTVSNSDNFTFVTEGSPITGLSITVDQQTGLAVFTGDVVVTQGDMVMTAIEMVGDRTKKSAPDKTIPARVQEVAYQNGTMVRVSGPNLILSPPLVLTESDANDILSALDAGFSSI
ncbi:MAG: hypothetical protein EBT13_07535, partial [Rhodobacteraceae bacterium]|nr:hypothetical protein [Paracoccaceae bacterium]